MFERIKNYIKGTRTELKYVNWPTRKQTINYTLLVIGVSLFVAAVLGGTDKLFSMLLNAVILH